MGISKVLIMFVFHKSITAHYVIHLLPISAIIEILVFIKTIPSKSYYFLKQCTSLKIDMVKFVKLKSNVYFFPFELSNTHKTPLS